MGARNGVTAAIMAQMGFSGVWDVLDGEHNVLIALSTDPQPEEMVAGLGSGQPTSMKSGPKPRLLRRLLGRYRRSTLASPSEQSATIPAALT